MPHYWLTYNKDGTRLGALILESASLTQARMDATQRRLDQRAQFAEGQQIDIYLAALLPSEAIGRMFSPAQGHELLDYLEEKGRRIAVGQISPVKQNTQSKKAQHKRGFFRRLISGQ